MYIVKKYRYNKIIISEYEVLDITCVLCATSEHVAYSCGTTLVYLAARRRAGLLEEALKRMVQRLRPAAGAGLQRGDARGDGAAPGGQARARGGRPGRRAEAGLA